MLDMCDTCKIVKYIILGVWCKREGGNTKDGRRVGAGNQWEPTLASHMEPREKKISESGNQGTRKTRK